MSKTCILLWPDHDSLPLCREETKTYYAHGFNSKQKRTHEICTGCITNLPLVTLQHADI